MRNDRSSTHAIVLWSLLVLFLFRVGAQLVQFISPVAVLPPFEAWQGSSLSYPVLLGSQCLILGVMAWATVAFARGTVRARRAIGAWLLVLGGIYGLSMSVRLILGVTVLADSAWFAKPIPVFFHVVLASYILVAGHFHWTHRGQGG